MSEKPFENCRFETCDLPGQCVAEGECHHPLADRYEIERLRAQLHEARAELETTKADLDGMTTERDSFESGWQIRLCL